jgi:hypothetical protein
LKLTHNQDRLIDAMKWVLPILVSLLAAANAAAQQDVTSTAVVPVVGSVLGATHAVWKTDVEIINETGSPTAVALELVAVPGAALILDLGPGATQRFTDIVGQAFGLERVLSPMRITTMGRRSVTVRASAYAIKETTISKMQPLGTAYGSEYAPFRALDGLAFSDDLRTNIGLVNFSDTEVDFLLALQRLPGRDLAVTHVTVGPESLLHVSIQMLFPLITKGEHFRVVVETPARNTYVYASVIDNEQTGTFIQPRVTSR